MLLPMISKKEKERTKKTRNPEKYQYSLIVKVVILLITTGTKILAISTSSRRHRS